MALQLAGGRSQNINMMTGAPYNDDSGAPHYDDSGPKGAWASPYNDDSGARASPKGPIFLLVGASAGIIIN